MDERVRGVQCLDHGQCAAPPPPRHRGSKAGPFLCRACERPRPCLRSMKKEGGRGASVTSMRRERPPHHHTKPRPPRRHHQGTLHNAPPPKTEPYGKKAGAVMPVWVVVVFCVGAWLVAASDSSCVVGATVVPRLTPNPPTHTTPPTPPTGKACRTTRTSTMTRRAWSRRSPPSPPPPGNPRTAPPQVSTAAAECDWTGPRPNPTHPHHLQLAAVPSRPRAGATAAAPLGRKARTGAGTTRKSTTKAAAGAAEGSPPRALKGGWWW